VDLFQDRRGALRGEDARSYNVLRPNAGSLGRAQGVEQIRPVFCEVRIGRLSEIEVVAEALEGLARLDRPTVRGTQSARDDQRVARVLFEQFVGLDVQGVRGDIPDGLIDSDDLASRV